MAVFGRELSYIPYAPCDQAPRVLWMGKIDYTEYFGCKLQENEDLCVKS